jgi:hypothetical protein
MSDEELVKRLRDAANGPYDMTPICAELLDADERIKALTAKLAKAVDGLQAVAQHEVSIFWGPDAEKNERASWRGVMRKVKAALAKIEGEKG